MVIFHSYVSLPGRVYQVRVLSDLDHQGHRQMAVVCGAILW